MKKDSEGTIRSFDSTSLLVFLYNWRKLLIIVCMVAAVGSAIVSFLITPMFEARVVMFPTSTNSISKSLISSNFGENQDINEFGEEEQAEQMLQILNSNEIRSRIITKHNLLEHYGIEPDSRFKNTLLYKEYDNNITFRRTEFMAVEIKVLDKDPEIAAAIANDIANLYDTVKNNLQKQRSVVGFQIVEKTYNDLMHEIQIKEDSLTVLRGKGINDYESQAERLYEAMGREMGRGNNQGVQMIQSMLDTLAKYGSAYVSIRDALEYDKKQLSELRAKYEEAKVDAAQALPQKFVVDYAFAPEKKSYPVRWLIVTVSTVSAFLLSIILLILADNFKRLKNNQINTKTDE